MSLVKTLLAAISLPIAWKVVGRWRHQGECEA
jgi:hypothetical protein